MADPSGDPAPQTGTGSSGSSETEAPPFPQPASENPNAAISDFDLTHLELEIDGIRKTFQDWTLEYADRYYPGLDKNVYHIPSVPFFMSSTKATEWDNSSSNDQINHERGVQNLEQEESGSQDQPASACSRSLESESSSDEDILLDGIVLKKGDHYNIPELRKRVPVSDIDKETKLKYDCVREYYVPGYPSRSVTSISLLRPSGRPLYTTIEEGAILTKNGTDDHVDRVSENVQRQTTESPATKHKHPMEVHTGNTLEAQRDFQVKPDLDSGFPTGKDHTIRGDMWHREYTRDSPATRYHPDFKKETQGKAEHTGRPDIWHREYTGDSPDTRDSRNIIGVKAEKLVHGALDQLGKQLGSMVALYNYDLPNYLEKLQQQIGYVKPGKGELDVMVLNLQSGPVLIEVKKANLEDDRTEEEKVRGKKETQKEKKRKRRSVMNLLKEAHHQLTNAEAVFNKVMASHGPLPTVKKVTAVPFLSRDELRRVLDVKPKPAVYASTFMCKDDLTDIGKWWEDHILCKPNPMSLETMRAIVGRFAGLLSTVEVPSLDKKRVEMRTHSDAVNEVGRQMSLILLTKQQAEILQCPDPVVQLCGPAGSGKTLMLGMRAMLWLEQGHVVYLQKNDLAIGCKTAKGEMLETLIKDLCKNRNIPVKNLRILNRLPDDKKQTTASHLLKDHSPQHVHAIFDEIWHKSGNQCTERYLEAMIQQGLSVWFSVPCMDNYTTVDGAKVFKLQAVLRSPPVIQRLLKELEGDLVPEWRDCYSTSGEDTGLTTDGPRIKIIQHSKHILHSQVPSFKVPGVQFVRIESAQ
ncbi:hypothetical protein BaRGS_00012279 [Batillaria attramentaria]|uniref:Uncharacterized protein n=1 Tax=Batillaria attramentaria TaxID=370345 RepID=A0ABD0LAF7_9CAEN